MRFPTALGFLGLCIWFSLWPHIFIPYLPDMRISYRKMATAHSDYVRKERDLVIPSLCQIPECRGELKLTVQQNCIIQRDRQYTQNYEKQQGKRLTSLIQGHPYNELTNNLYIKLTLSKARPKDSICERFSYLAGLRKNQK